MARMVHQKGTASAIGAGGVTIEPDENGVFEVPDALAPELESHGFIPEPPPKAKGKGSAKTDGGAS
jgi:hypothetical protein